MLGSIFQVIASAIQSSAPPFPVFVMAYTINGIGGALGVSSQPVLLILQISEITLLVFNRIGCAGERIRWYLGT